MLFEGVEWVLTLSNANLGNNTTCSRSH